MSTTTFDTLTYSKKLQELGFTREQSEGVAQLQREIIDERLATKHDLRELETRIDIKLAELKNDLLKWMVGGFIAQTALLVAVLAFMRPW